MIYFLNAFFCSLFVLPSYLPPSVIPYSASPSLLLQLPYNANPFILFFCLTTSPSFNSRHILLSLVILLSSSLSSFILDLSFPLRRHSRCIRGALAKADSKEDGEGRRKRQTTETRRTLQCYCKGELLNVGYSWENPVSRWTEWLAVTLFYSRWSVYRDRVSLRSRDAEIDK